MGHHRWLLNPSRSPQRLGLKLPLPELEPLERLSVTTGSSPTQLTARLPSRAVATAINDF